MPKLLLVDLPLPHDTVQGAWYNGFPLHQGSTPESLNIATKYAQDNKIIPNQNEVQRDFTHFVDTLHTAGFTTEILPFPPELNTEDNLHHDAVFIRDAGIMTAKHWIKANFSVKDRIPEADSHAKTIMEMFHKTVVELPPEAKFEGGEAHLVKTADGSYYFGGISRANRAGHEFIHSIIQPDHFFIIESAGYHLDTVLSPILDSSNRLIALLVADYALAPKTKTILKTLPLEIIAVDPIDSAGTEEKLGTYAINGISAPGVLVNNGPFQTPGVEKRLAELNIKRFSSPLTWFRFAGGSCHCLVNEIR